MPRPQDRARELDAHEDRRAHGPGEAHRQELHDLGRGALCGKYHESEVRSVMPYFAFTNDLISQVLVDHFQADIRSGPSQGAPG